MGLFEIDDFAAGTQGRRPRPSPRCAAVTVAGGGDTVAPCAASASRRSITHVSTGGGASMEFLEGRALPGVEALMDT